eukprot:808111_1
MSKNDVMFGCRICDFDLCNDCYFGSTDNDEKKQEQKDQVKYEVNNGSSVTFYPTPNIERGTKKFATKLFVKSSKCPDSFEGAFDYKKVIVDDNESSTTKNSFINCAELAYAKHYPLLIKPEHIFLLILQGISIHVDKNSEKLRDKYVNHTSGKKELHMKADSFVRKSPNNDWSAIISGFVQQIDKNTKKDIVPLFDSNFSSSTLNEKIAAKVTLMSTCKNYFDYSMSTILCGFPQITLDGNINDWCLLKDKVEKLLTSKVSKGFGAKWLKSLIPILDKFILAFKGDISMVFWNSMIYRGQWSYMEEVDGGGYCFGPTEYVKRYKSFISGWINVFFPYIGRGNYENRWCFIPYSNDKMANGQYKGNKKELDEALGPDPKQFPEGIASAPVKWIYFGKEINLEFTSGFMGYEQDKNTLCLTPTIGWYIKEKAKKDEYDFTHLYEDSD